jgi:hypothetical protein
MANLPRNIVRSDPDHVLDAQHELANHGFGAYHLQELVTSFLQLPSVEQFVEGPAFLRQAQVTVRLARVRGGFRFSLAQPDGTLIIPPITCPTFIGTWRAQFAYLEDETMWPSRRVEICVESPRYFSFPEVAFIDPQGRRETLSLEDEDFKRELKGFIADFSHLPLEYRNVDPQMLAGLDDQHVLALLESRVRSLEGLNFPPQHFETQDD